MEREREEEEKEMLMEGKSGRRELMKAEGCLGIGDVRDGSACKG